MSHPKSGNLGRSALINEAIKVQAQKEKDMETVKATLIQGLRDEIDDQHRMLEDELKTVVIEVDDSTINYCAGNSCNYTGTDLAIETSVRRAGRIKYKQNR